MKLNVKEKKKAGERKLVVMSEKSAVTLTKNRSLNRNSLPYGDGNGGIFGFCRRILGV
jgi:hypothetical protein